MTDINAKTRILENAVNMFNSKGFHGTSMRDIASAAECSLPSGLNFTSIDYANVSAMES